MSAPLPPTDSFRMPLRVRYEETDAAGVVYYANYLTWFEVARIELLRELGVPITEVERRGVALPVVEAGCRYLKPAHVDDLLELRLWLRPPRRASFAFDYQVWRTEELLAEGHTVHTTVERATLKPVRMPEWFAELLAGVAHTAMTAGTRR